MISDTLRVLVDKQLLSLRRVSFAPDPLFPTYSRRQFEGSAIKRHGGLIEAAIVEVLANDPDYLLWQEAKFSIPAAADHAVQSQRPDEIALTRLPYGAAGRSLQIDLLAYSRSRKRLGAYEIKRGFGRHDAGKLRSIRRDAYATQTVLASYGVGRGEVIDSAVSRVIFYYGARSIPPPWSLVGAELDEHFGCLVSDRVEAMTDYFRRSLDGLAAPPQPGLEFAMKSQTAFLQRWSLDDLLRIDPELHMALLDQQSMLAQAVDAAETAVHAAAMERGWRAALRRMEDDQIDKALAVFPGAAVRIREKPDTKC